MITASAYNHKLSAYEALQQYNFPAGLLPNGVTGYTINATTGEFSAYLNGSCSFKLENAYELRYKPVIKGVISQGRLEKLSGVRVKAMLFWLDIVEVKRKNDDLEFSVGFTSANFPVSNFEECPECGIRLVSNFKECPECGCGLDCGNEKEKGKGKESLSSS